MKSDERVCLISTKGLRIAEDNIFPNRNIGLAFIASSLRAHGCHVDIINTKEEDKYTEEIVDAIEKKEYGFIGISIISVSCWKYVIGLIRRIRNIGLKKQYRPYIIIGGIFPAKNPNFIFKEFFGGEVDWVCLGEGEVVFRKLVEAIENRTDWRNIDGIAYMDNKNVILNPPVAIQNLDTLPFAADDDLEELIERGEPINIQTSRGCYGVCKFCSIRKFYGEGGEVWRARSPENVIQELALLKERFRAKKFIFVDDNFIGPGEIGAKRALEICRLISDRGLAIEFYMECRANDITDTLAEALAKAGCTYVFLGFESGSDKQLKEIGKNFRAAVNKKAADSLSKFEIRFSPGFIMFTPECTLDDLKKNIDMLRYLYEVNTDLKNELPLMLTPHLPFTAMEPLRGTDLFDTLLNDKRLVTLNKDNGKGVRYIVTDPDAELARRLFTGEGLLEYIQNIESELEKYMNVSEYKDNNKIIDQYEKRRSNLVLDFLSNIIGFIENKNLAPFSKELMRVKKDLAILYFEYKKNLNQSLK